VKIVRLVFVSGFLPSTGGLTLSSADAIQLVYIFILFVISTIIKNHLTSQFPIAISCNASVHAQVSS
jgi:hypothetical protein